MGYLVTFRDMLLSALKAAGFADVVRLEYDVSTAPSIEVINLAPDSSLRKLWIGFEEVGEVLIVIDTDDLSESLQGYWWKTELPGEDLIAFAIGWVDAFVNGHLLLVDLRPWRGQFTMIMDVRDPSLYCLDKLHGVPKLKLHRYPPAVVAPDESDTSSTP